MTILSNLVGADSHLLDRLAIEELVRRERFARDQGEWDELLECYTPEATVITTWFSGLATDFVAASREMATNGRHSKHLITPMRVDVVGDRALSESYAEIHNRDVLFEVEVDMIQYCRFFSRVRRDGDRWRLASFEGIYQRDVLTAVDPSQALPVDWSELRMLRASYRVWAWTLGLRGYAVSQEKLGDDRPDVVNAFYARERSWLHCGDV